MYLFVCTGNRFRSMLAEALAQKRYQDKKFESSGTEATGPIYEPVKDLIEENNLEKFVTYNPEQVSEDQIQKADRVICMTESHREFIKDTYQPEEGQLEVWNISDADPEDNLEPIFDELKEKVENMF
jgi:protein-tyrosine-phosphatase